MRTTIVATLLWLISLVNIVWAQASDQAAAPKSSSTTNPSPSCPAGQDYFEADLRNLETDKKNKSLLSFLMNASLSKPHVDARCIESSLSHVSSEASRFVRCQGEKVIPRAQTEPCSSSRYVKMIHHSFELVASCLKDFVSDSQNPYIQNDWVEAYFKILTKESGLHVNVVSPTGAIGASQLTSDYIEDFMEWNLDATREHLKNSKSILCQKLGEEILSNQSLVGNSKTCSRVEIKKGQPLLGLVIGFSNMRVNKKRVTKPLYDNPKLIQMPEREKAQLEIMLTSLAYNMGSGGIMTPLLKTLRTYNNQPVMNPSQFLTRLQERIPHMIHLTRTVLKNGELRKVKGYSKARIDEMTHYLSRINKRYSSVLKAAQVQSCRLQ